MPLYTYEHPVTSETVDILQTMKEDHVYVDKEGVEWKRVFYSPQASIDSQTDPFDNNAFISNTGNKKGSYGDIMDHSKEMSQKRKDKLGFDPVQKKYFQEYSKKRRGLKHPQDRG